VRKVNDLELHPLPLSAAFLFAAQGLSNPYVYRFSEDRWWLRSNGREWWLIDRGDDGLKLVDNPFA
jgi:hypothetical protein